MGGVLEKLSLADAVGRLRPGQKVLLPPGSAEPAAFIEELCRQADRLAPLTLMGGLLLGGYPFLRPEHARHFQWVTWQLMPPASAAWERGQAHLVPARYFDALSLFGRGGPRGPPRPGPRPATPPPPAPRSPAGPRPIRRWSSTRPPPWDPWSGRSRRAWRG